MKKNAYALIFALVVCFASVGVQAGTRYLPEKTFVGRIVELGTNQSLVQVGDYSFVMGSIFADSGAGEVSASRGDLQVGQLVQVEVARKGVDLSEAKKIIILKGERLQQAIRQMELPPTD